MTTCARPVSALCKVSREACRDFALSRSWETSARQFIGHMNLLVNASNRKPRPAWPRQATAQG